MPGIEKIIGDYRIMGYLILGISNQGGVAHAYRNLGTLMKNLSLLQTYLRKILFILLSIALTILTGM